MISEHKTVVKSIIATGNIDQDGNIVPVGFQPDMLDHIADTAIGKDVKLAYGGKLSLVGRVVKSYRESDHVVAYLEMDVDAESLGNMRAEESDVISVIPALDVRRWHVEGDTFVYDDAELVALLITSRPVGDDFALAPVEIVSS